MPKVLKKRCRMRSTGHVARHTAAAMASASASQRSELLLSSAHPPISRLTCVCGLVRGR
jgi:hypothetical protein